MSPRSPDFENADQSTRTVNWSAGNPIHKTALNKCYGKSLAVDGQFGPKTRQALTQAQQSHGQTTGLGTYTDQDAWTLRFYGISGLRLICARIDGPILD
jgi:peptidoglycan hydrolase-like protein with peptidoglycan-binding domain